jgi:hypothetical protein
MYFNGCKYDHVDGGAEGDAIKKRWAGVDGHIVTQLGGRPAVLVNGELYVQGERLLPGSGGIWERLKKVRGK